jgi:dolichyl-phosphate beta-glucosyltransferase
MKLSIIIPAYNEEKRIKETLKKIINYLNKKKTIYEIILVDDCSTDRTIEISKKINKNIIILKNKNNMGKGYCVKKGIQYAKNELILFTDADLATPIEEIDNMIDLINKDNDIIIASRSHPKSKIIVKQSLIRQFMGNIFPFLVKLLLIKNISDTQCGFKLFKKKVAKEIIKYQTINRFSFDVELLFIAKKKGYKIKEVPVFWIDKKGSKLKLIKDSSKMFLDLIKIKYNSYNKRYN